MFGDLNFRREAAAILRHQIDAKPGHVVAAATKVCGMTFREVLRIERGERQLAPLRDLPEPRAKTRDSRGRQESEGQGRG